MGNHALGEEPGGFALRGPPGYSDGPACGAFFVCAHRAAILFRHSFNVASWIAITSLALATQGVALAQAPANAAPGGAIPNEPLFDILEFVVTGDTLLGQPTVERAVYSFLGPGRTVADAEGARKALEKAYQDAGFLTVSVVLPPQRVGSASAEVQLLVVQAPVDKLRVTGAQYTLPSQIRESLPSLAPGNVPNFNELQQELAQLTQRTPASAEREITPLLAAGEQPGTLNVELKVQDKLPATLSIEINNKQSLDTQAGRLEAAASFDNLFQSSHSVGLSWFYSPSRPSHANIQTLSYSLPAGGPGDRLSMLFTRSDSDIATAVGGASISRGQTLRLRWRDALAAQDGFSHGLSWGLTARDLRDRSRSVGGVETQAPALRYTTFQAAYDLQLFGGSNGSSSTRSSSLQAEFTLSPPGINRREVDCFGTQREQFACKRPDAKPGFQVFTLTMTHREPLGRWSLLARLQAQAADAPLVSAEQVVYGGQDSVRGYFEGEQAGDLGAALRLELSGPLWQSTGGLEVGGLAFVDAASTRRLFASAQEKANVSLASAGLGLRINTSAGLQASLTWAQVLRNTTRLNSATGVQAPVSGSDAGRERRWDLNLRQAF